MAAISIKTGMFLLLGILTISSAQAKVTPINEYNMTITDDGKQAFNQTCKAYGWFDSIQANAICTKQQTLMDGTQCYACHCDSKYEYTCASEGITGSGEACSIGGTPKYTACTCAKDYISTASVKNVGTYFNTPEVYEDEDSKVKCYKKDSFTCADGYHVYKSTTEETTYGITYKTESPFTESSLACVVSYDLPSECQTSAPGEDLSCLTRATPTLSLIGEGKSTVYCFTGDCSGEGDCIGNDIPVCADVSTQRHSASGYTCRKVNGCLSGAQSNNSYFCSSSEPDSTYFVSTGVSAGTHTCYQVTGCNTSNGYKLANMGASNSTTYKTDDSTNYTYTVQKHEDNSQQIVCRMPSGCRTDKKYYNFACEGGCWDGWLSLWAK